MKHLFLVNLLYFILILNSQLTYKLSNKLNAIDFQKLKQQSKIYFGKKHVCNICNCKRFHSIKCFVEKRNENTIETWKNVTLESSYFNGFHLSVRQLFIDLDYFNLNLKIHHNTFSKMKNLIVVFMDSINDLVIVPDLESSENLKELTIQYSNLKIVKTEFCAKKIHLQKIDFSYNDFEDLRYVFDQCESLTLLDLSYNRLKSLSEIFNKNSNLINLQLDSNQIEEIGQDDLSFLTELTELSISKNRLKFIHENAFDKLKKLVKLNLSKNNLYSLPQNSLVYKLLEFFNVNENVNLLYFPNADKFLHLKDLKVHYPYHCCPFLKKKTWPHQQNQHWKNTS